MATPPYPIIPGPFKRGWFERHPAWKIPIGCFILILLGGASLGQVFLLVESSFHHSEVYAQAMARAGEDMQVRTQMGTPLTAAWLVCGNLNFKGSSGYADLSIPITGSRQKGRIRAVAVKGAGTWRFKQLVVNVEGQTENIDLLAAEPASMHEF
jgi:Cytochrome oxidase complex assembly protein 1